MTNKFLNSNLAFIFLCQLLVKLRIDDTKWVHRNTIQIYKRELTQFVVTGILYSPINMFFAPSTFLSKGIAEADLVSYVWQSIMNYTWEDSYEI